MEERAYLWGMMLDADMNARYWQRSAARAHRMHRGISWIAALLSSGAFAAILFEGPKWVQTSVALMAAGLAAAQAFYGTKDDVAELSALHASWLDLSMRLDRLWMRQEAGEDVRREIDAIQAEEVSLSRSAARFSMDGKVLLELQDAVERSRGIRR